MTASTYTTVFYLVFGKATFTPHSYFPGKEEQEIDVVLDVIRGMTDSGYLGFRDSHGSKDMLNVSSLRFPDKESATFALEGTSKAGWCFKDVRDLKVVKITSKVTTEVTEEEV